MNSKKTILLCAYACEPNKGSEPGVGWETVIHLAIQDTVNNYFVVTRKNNRPVIECENYPKNLKFIYYELPSLFLYIKRKGDFVRTYYYFWMLGAVFKLWKRRNEFHIINHITFVNDWLPSLFVLLKNKNNYFVWGPIGSNNEISLKFLNSVKEKITESIRILLQKTFRNFDVFFWLCKLKSDIIIGINEDVKNKIKLNKTNLNKFKSIPAIAIDKNQLSFKKSHNKANEKLRIISVGRLMYIKNFKLTLSCFAHFLNLVSTEERDKIELIIIGKGNLKKDLIRFVNKLNIEKNVVFKGQISQNEVITNFKSSDLFLFPTLESAGFVVLEAMTYYLPVIALDYGGPKQFIKEKREFQLASSENSFEEITSQLANILLRLYRDVDLRIDIGVLNHKTVSENFTWEYKTDYILNLYKDLS